MAIFAPDLNEQSTPTAFVDRSTTGSTYAAASPPEDAVLRAAFTTYMQSFPGTARLEEVPPDNTMPKRPRLNLSGLKAISEVEPSRVYSAKFIRMETAQEKFQRLVRQWKAGRDPTAMTSRMVAHPAYRAIIQMGPIAIPLILRELRREPDEWFYALAKLTGEPNVIPDACRGRFRPMVDAWLSWGRRNDHLT